MPSQVHSLHPTDIHSIIPTLAHSLIPTNTPLSSPTDIHSSTPTYSSLPSFQSTYILSVGTHWVVCGRDSYANQTCSNSSKIARDGELHGVRYCSIKFVDKKKYARIRSVNKWSRVIEKINAIWTKVIATVSQVARYVLGASCIYPTFVNENE